MFGHSYFGARFFGPRYWGPASGAVIEPPVVVTPTPFGGSRKGKRKRRLFTYDDGRTVEIASDYQLSEIVNELMQARQSDAEQAKTERRAKGKPSRKIKRAQSKPVPLVDPMIIYQMIEAMGDAALRQSTILIMLDEYQRMQAEDEDLTLILLSL